LAYKKVMSDPVSPLDASILALLAQIPKGVGENQKLVLEKTQQNLLERLSPAAREIGLAVLATDAEGAFSASALATAGEMKRWAVANNSR
jgi:hypothetical protein